MKTLVSSVVIAAALVAPAASFAQGDHSVARVQTAQAHVDSQSGTVYANNGYGGSTAGSSQTGRSQSFFSQASCPDSGNERNPLCYRN